MNTILRFFLVLLDHLITLPTYNTDTTVPVWGFLGIYQIIYSI